MEYCAEVHSPGIIIPHVESQNLEGRTYVHRDMRRSKFLFLGNFELKMKGFREEKR